MAELDQEHESHKLGMHTEQLSGRTQQVFFRPSEEENFTYPYAAEVDFAKEAEFDAANMEIRDINLKIRELVNEGHGTEGRYHHYRRQSRGLHRLHDAARSNHYSR